LAVKHLPLQDHEIRSCFPSESSILHATVVMRKEIFCSAGGYRGAFEDAEDYELWLRMGRLCQLANLGEVVYRYRIHPTQVTYRKVKRQALSYLAAEAVHLSDSNGLGSVHEITPERLAKFGVTEATVQRAIATFYRNEINLMCWAGQESAALALELEMLRSSRWEHIEKRKRFIADNWLRAAGLFWGQEQFFQSLAAAGRALVVRPIVAGRPIKRLLDRLSAALTGEKSANAAGTN
jgi:hypothetical protein